MRLNQSIAVSENGFIFNPVTGDSFTLNTTGMQIIAMLKTGKTMEQIKEALASEYYVDAMVLERYLEDFIAELKRNNLLEE